MVKLTKEVISIGCGSTKAISEKWQDHLQVAMDRFEINTPSRAAAFLANIGVESGGLLHLKESLFYRDPARIAAIFRSSMDVNENRKLDAADIEFARGYTCNSEKLANRAYANRNGNGNEASGDGFRYRGRGLIQITGKANYKMAGDDLGIDLVARPDLVSDNIAVAALAAASFFKRNGCNQLADKDAISQIVRVINGVLPNENNHGPLRLERYWRCKAALS